MSIRFYSTNVSPEKSLGEVAELLRKYGAQRFEQVWEGNRTVAVRFNLPVPEAELGFMAVVLKPQTAVLAQQLRQKHRIDDPDQVERVAWRQLKGVLEGILIAVDTGMFTVPELFLGMAESHGGEPLWRVLLDNQEGTQLLLTP